MVVVNSEPDIRFRHRTLNMGIATMLITAALTPVVYMAIGNESVVDASVAMLWVVGLVAAVIMFFGMACILYDRFRRMRMDRDYWMYLCNEYRNGRSESLESVWRGLGAHELKDMAAVEAELPERWKRRHLKHGK